MKIKTIAYFLSLILKDRLRGIMDRLKYLHKIVQAKRSSNPDIQLQLIYYIQNNNHTEIVKIFESGIDVDLPLYRKDLKATSLALAAYEGDLDLVKLLLSKKACINPEDPELISPLIMATLNNKTEIVIFLLDHGADLEVKNIRSGTALECAAEIGYVALVKLFLERGTLPSMKALQASCFRGSLECIDLLLEYGADINSYNEEGNTPLITASYYGHEKAVKRLLEKNANINATNTWGDTALFFAIRRNHQDVSKLLIEQGIDLSRKNKFGLSPLLQASAIGNQYVVSLINENLIKRITGKGSETLL